VRGPVPFMAAHKRALIDAGVAPKQVHTEVFGSGTV
jgi:ferredoxin-NADP reductase